jgi:hypothetical protein
MAGRVLGSGEGTRNGGGDVREGDAPVGMVGSADAPG